MQKLRNAPRGFIGKANVADFPGTHKIGQYMQGFGVLSFLLCALSMLALFLDAEIAGKWMFGVSIVTLAVSLVLSLIEVLVSTEALSVVVEDLEKAGRNNRES